MVGIGLTHATERERANTDGSRRREKTMSSKNALGLRGWWRRHFQGSVVLESLQQIGLLLEDHKPQEYLRDLQTSHL